MVIMDKEGIKSLIDSLMEGNDWILTEPEEGLIILQRKNNKAKWKVTNLRSR
jgi:hypothetical protein